MRRPLSANLVHPAHQLVWQNQPGVSWAGQSLESGIPNMVLLAASSRDKHEANPLKFHWGSGAQELRGKGGVGTPGH